MAALTEIRIPCVLVVPVVATEREWREDDEQGFVVDLTPNMDAARIEVVGQ